MVTRTHSLALLLLAAALSSAAAQQLVVVVQSPVFALDTRLSTPSGFPALVVTTESPAFTLDTRLSAGSTQPGLVVAAESVAFILDTRLSPGSTFAALVVTAESPAFTLDTRLPGRREDLIVETVSPVFEVNTMWIGIRRTARAGGSPVELYWPTNAPGFYPQSAPPPLQPSMPWQDMTNAISEADGFYRSRLDPQGTAFYYRLKL